MPTYEYECGACGHQLEAFQSMSEKPLKKCPECKKTKLNRLIGSGSGIIFKGSGFYETDYKRTGSSSYSSQSKAESSPAPAPSPTKTDTTTPKKDSGSAKSDA